MSAVTVALVNNMPDAELHNTESQFRALVDAASEAAGVPVRLRVFTIPEVPRSSRAQVYLARHCEDIATLWDSEVEGLIVTGMEPRARALNEEPYWKVFVQLVGWAAEHTHSAIWSCLAAHACVFSLHGVQRQPLGKKLFGLFDCALASPHPTFLGSRSAWWEPHSRHNGLLEGELARHGYEIWSHSPRTGPDIFAKQVRSLFVFLQGHLEYDVEALLREYRRDIGRYLRGRSASYPEIPENYFAPAAVEALLAFRNQAMRNREVESLAHLPPIAAASLLHRWDDIASAFYARWLQHLAARPGRHQGAAPLNFLPQHGGGKLMRNAPA